jgi:hypothetical protein
MALVAAERHHQLLHVRRGAIVPNLRVGTEERLSSRRQCWRRRRLRVHEANCPPGAAHLARTGGDSSRSAEGRLRLSQAGSTITSLERSADGTRTAMPSWARSAPSRCQFWHCSIWPAPGGSRQSKRYALRAFPSALDGA